MRFTIERAFAASLAIHGAIVLPVAIQMAPTQPDYDETLVIDLKGITAEDQADEKVTEQTQGASAQQQAANEQKTRLAQNSEKREAEGKPEETAPAQAAKQEETKSAKDAPSSPGSANVLGGE